MKLNDDTNSFQRLRLIYNMINVEDVQFSINVITFVIFNVLDIIFNSVLDLGIFCIQELSLNGLGRRELTLRSTQLAAIITLSLR